MTEVGSLEAEARKRKERIMQMRNRSMKIEGEPPQKKINSEGSAPVFRSYKPTDENLKKVTLPLPEPPEVTDQVKEHLEAAKPQPLLDEVDLVNLAPRKPDWDLKRDVAKKLEKLERRTQRSIAELIRIRLQSGDQDLATMVEANMAANNVDDED
ncbi:hypothetical protein CAPTEDRAFT_179668 [Capitella teleta]|uniref:Coiled-coil domain-containing protein 12 n=1 Tax=Capitella teleta TaxID=283909 RepID=R7UXR5_CAPTE|nr:hypothetical protein CAPTEDRAFT_179668 [Capitella teleta]|eukprot:ELU11114.1 hypothetical protein CAPTEDRAFT_179668 [Capitella teleta]